MRPWYKYHCDPDGKGVRRLPLDHDFAEHSAGMDGYVEDEAYSSQEAFFGKYFKGYHLRRLEYYDDFLRRRLCKKWKILSVASGRCANELKLLEDGFVVECSDMGTPESHKSLKRLFPRMVWFEHDILQGPGPRLYDAIICLSMIYLLDEERLAQFFRNVFATLERGGHLLLDSAGSPDVPLGFLIHDIILPSEVFLLRLYRYFATGKMPGLIIKHQGWRRTNDEIVEIARQSGFVLECCEEYAFLAEFRRSAVFSRAVKEGTRVERLFERFGRGLPYIRMFDFRKF